MTSLPIVAVADLHGHRRLFDVLLCRLDEDFADGYVLVTLYYDDTSRVVLDYRTLHGYIDSPGDSDAVRGLFTCP